MALRLKGFSFELIKMDEVDGVIGDIVKTASGGILGNKEFLKRAITNPDSITVVCKDKTNVLGLINGLAIRNQPISPQITLIWVKDRTNAILGIAPALIERCTVEVKRRRPNSLSIDVSLPTIDIDSVALYSMNGFVIEGFIKGQYNGPDMIVMRRNLQDPSKTPVS